MWGNKLETMGKKEDKYAFIIVGKIRELFDENSDGVTIDNQELKEGENLTHFIHALANLAPAFIFSEMTGDKKGILSFNHLANGLVVQYSIKDNKE